MFIVPSEAGDKQEIWALRAYLWVKFVVEIPVKPICY